MKKKISTLLLSLFFLTAVSLIIASKVKAASFQFEPTTINISKGENFTVKINIDAGSDNLVSSDAYVTYDSNYLKVDSVSPGSYFPTVSNDTSTAGKVYIAGMVDDPATSSSGNGTLATISFQGVADGQISLTIDCSSSKIIKDDINATNVMECSSNGSADVVVGTGSSSSPQQLPKTGVFDHVVKWSLPGMILLFIGGALKIIL